MKYINFEEFLQEKHAEDYHGTDDDMPDAFEHWLSNVEQEEMMEYADLFAISLLRTAEKRIETLCTHFPVRESDEFDLGAKFLKDKVLEILEK